MYQDTSAGKNGKDMALFSLQKIIEGGIHDHIGGGFHRYSVDKYWHIPHYEKMLYDQAQLACTFLEAFQISKDELYSDAAIDIFGYVAENLMHEDGGIFSAEDADSLNPETGKMSEGSFYVWRYDEIAEVLGSDSNCDMFCAYYGIDKKGNTRPESDPHGELKGTNTLYIRNDLEDIAKKYSVSMEECRRILEENRMKLKEHRRKRPKPHLDDKIITSWNGLMLSAFSKGYQVLHEPKYLQYAQKIANFVKTEMYQDGKLLRSFRNGPSNILAFATDYAFMIRGLLDLYEASGDFQWLSWATELQEKQHELFWDEEKGGYWNTTSKGKILFQSKEIYDGAEPSENSVSFQNISRLAKMLSDDYWYQQGERLMSAFHQYINKAPQICPEMAPHISSPVLPNKQIILAGDIQSQEVQDFIRIVHQNYDPYKVLLFVNKDSNDLLSPHLPHVQNIPLNTPAVYICQHQSCQAPIFSPEELKPALT